MDIILHLGAHRTASTSFQAYMRANADTLQQQGIGFWGPLRTRRGLLSGVLPELDTQAPARRFARAQGRISMRCEGMQRAGITQLVVSDENMIGTMRGNLRDSALYPAAGQRLARYYAVFGHRVRRVVLSIRSLENYWSSLLAYGAGRGFGFPDAADLDYLVTQPRSWRDVIMDIRCACPEAELLVDSFESMGGRPELRLGAMLPGLASLPMEQARVWQNRALDCGGLRRIAGDCGATAIGLGQAHDRWMPFDQAQAAALREIYLDDLFWLRAGADGFATLTDETGPDMTGIQPLAGRPARGPQDDNEGRRLARSG